MIELIKGAWPWYVSGPLMAITMFMLLWFGGRFGVSSNFRNACAMLGADRLSDYFKINWKHRVWNFVFVAGTILGAYLASTYLVNPEPMDINPSIIEKLKESGLTMSDSDIAPKEIFSRDGLLSWRGFIMIVIGGFLVGFGTRYGEGCTSGHAISGLSNLQLGSLIAVIGFFIGGLVMTHLIMPSILNL